MDGENLIGSEVANSQQQQQSSATTASEQSSSSSKVDQTHVASKHLPYGSTLSPGHQPTLDGYSALLTNSPPRNDSSCGAGGAPEVSRTTQIVSSASENNNNSVDFLASTGAGNLSDFQQPPLQLVNNCLPEEVGESACYGAGGENGLITSGGAASQGGGFNHSNQQQQQYGKPASAPSPTHMPFSPGPASSRQPASVPPPFSPALNQQPPHSGSASVPPGAVSSSAPVFQQPRPGAMYPPNRHTSSSPAIIPQQQQQQILQQSEPSQILGGGNLSAQEDSASFQNQSNSQSIIKNMADIVNRVPDQCGLVSALSKVEQMHKQPQAGSASSSVSSALSPAPSISSPSAHLLAQQQQQQQQNASFHNSNSQQVQQPGSVPSQQPLMRPNSRPSSIGVGGIQSPQQLQQPGSVKMEPSLQQQMMMQQQQLGPKSTNGSDVLQWSTAANVQQPQQPMMHVFDSKLANEAAQAVRQGATPSIIDYHLSFLVQQQGSLPQKPPGELPPPPPNQQSGGQDKSGLTSQQLSARNAKLKEIEDMSNMMGIKKEKGGPQTPQDMALPPGAMPPGMFQPGPNSPGMMPPDMNMRMRHEHEAKRRQQQMMMANMPPEAFGGPGFPPGHMMPPIPEGALMDPNGCVFDPQTGMVFRPPHIASPGGPRYPSPFPPGFQGPPGMPPGMGMMPGQPPPGFPIGMMPGPPPGSGRANGPSGDQPPSKKPKRAPKKAKQSSENKASAFVAANNAAMQAAQQQQQMVLQQQQHPPRLQTVPSPRQLSALADIDAQELIITRQLNSAYRDDLGQAEQQSLMQQVHSPLAMHQLLQQQQQQLRLPPNAMYGGPRESGRLSHGQPGKGGPVDPFILQQQQQEMMLHQQRIAAAQMGQDPNLMPPNLPFDNGPPSQQFMIPSDQMNQQQMMNSGYPGGPPQQGPSGGPPQQGGPHHRLPPHMGNVHIQQREAGGTVHYLPAQSGPNQGGQGQQPPGQQQPGPPQMGPMHGHPSQQQIQQQIAVQQQMQREQQFLEESYGNPEIMSALAQQQQQHHAGRRMMMPQGYEMRFDPQQQMYPPMAPQDMPPQFYEQQVLEQPFLPPGSPGSQEAAVLAAQQQQADFLYQQQLQQQLAQQQAQQQQGQPGLQPQLPDSMYGGMPPGDPSLGYGYGPGPGGYPGEYMGPPQHQEFVPQQQPWLS